MDRRWRKVVPALILSGACATPAPPGAFRRAFDFERDTFAYTNGLYWTYDFDAAVAIASAEAREQSEGYGQRCLIMSLAVRQFFYAAEFAPEASKVSDAQYANRVRAVLDSDPRADRPATSPVRIPGYPDLRSFSDDHEALFKSALGGPWRSYSA